MAFRRGTLSVVDAPGQVGRGTRWATAGVMGISAALPVMELGRVALGETWRGFLVATAVVATLLEAHPVIDVLEAPESELTGETLVLVVTCVVTTALEDATGCSRMVYCWPPIVVVRVIGSTLVDPPLYRVLVVVKVSVQVVYGTPC